MEVGIMITITTKEISSVIGLNGTKTLKIYCMIFHRKMKITTENIKSISLAVNPFISPLFSSKNCCSY